MAVSILLLGKCLCVWILIPQWVAGTGPEFYTVIVFFISDYSIVGKTFNFCAAVTKNSLTASKLTTKTSNQRQELQ